MDVKGPVFLGNGNIESTCNYLACSIVSDIQNLAGEHFLTRLGLPQQKRNINHTKFANEEEREKKKMIKLSNGWFGKGTSTNVSRSYY